MSSVSVFFCIIFLFFQSPNHLVECRHPQFFAFHGMVFISLLDPRFDILPRIINTYWRFQVLDARTQRIHRSALVSVRNVLFIFDPTKHLVMQALEDYFEDISINIGCPTVSHHDTKELIQGSLGCNFVTLILYHMSA
jgi:hypothetical protein